MLSYYLLSCVSIFAVTHAAECFGSGNADFSVSDYQNEAQRICNGVSSIDLVVGVTGFPTAYQKVVHASYSGTAKIHCWVSLVGPQ